MEENRTHNEIMADAMGECLRKFASNPDSIENFVSYLSNHFGDWFKKYANTPEGLLYELKTFSEIS